MLITIGIKLGKPETDKVVYKDLACTVTEISGGSMDAFDIGKLSLVDIIHHNPFSVALIYSIALAMIIYLIDYWEQKKTSIVKEG